jgi:hypothetical protein
MRKLVLTCAAILCLPLVVIACGGEEPPDEPTVADTTAPPDRPWYPEDDDPGGAPSGGSIFDPCARAACWDWDRRAWVSNPPWDDIANPPVSPETPEMQGGLPAKKLPPASGGQAK